jgi:hypothetical protein
VYCAVGFDEGGKHVGIELRKGTGSGQRYLPQRIECNETFLVCEIQAYVVGVVMIAKLISHLAKSNIDIATGFWV